MKVIKILEYWKYKWVIFCLCYCDEILVCGYILGIWFVVCVLGWECVFEYGIVYKL